MRSALGLVGRGRCSFTLLDARRSIRTCASGVTPAATGNAFDLARLARTPLFAAELFDLRIKKKAASQIHRV
jgi:hypothetical protein